MDAEIMEEITFEPSVYDVYARPDASGRVTHIFSTCFETPQEGDVLIKSGSGDEFVHVGYYQIYTAQGAHRYMVAGAFMKEATEEEIAEEIASFPVPPETESEKIARLKEELTHAQLALAEQYEENIRLSDEVTNTQIALTEIYEGMEV